MKPVYICDLDGTVADLSHRLPLIQQEPKDWDMFFAGCDKDEPIRPVVETLRLLAKSGAEILYVTGRSSCCSFKTLEWIERNSLPLGCLYMRTDGDHRPDNIVKSELLDQVLEHYERGQILGAFEDRKQVVDMYRKRGLMVFHVADGDF